MPGRIKNYVKTYSHMELNKCYNIRKEGLDEMILFVFAFLKKSIAKLKQIIYISFDAFERIILSYESLNVWVQTVCKGSQQTVLEGK